MLQTGMERLWVRVLKLARIASAHHPSGWTAFHQLALLLLNPRTPAVTPWSWQSQAHSPGQYEGPPVQDALECLGRGNGHVEAVQIVRVILQGTIQ
jgi:hypothetical protein